MGGGGIRSVDSVGNATRLYMALVFRAGLPLRPPLLV